MAEVRNPKTQWGKHICERIDIAVTEIRKTPTVLGQVANHRLVSAHELSVIFIRKLEELFAENDFFQAPSSVCCEENGCILIKWVKSGEVAENKVMTDHDSLEFAFTGHLITVLITKDDKTTFVNVSLANALKRAHEYLEPDE